MTESYLPWVSVSHTIANIGFGSSLITGCLLIFLNLFYVRKTFGSYRYLMMSFTSLGIAFATLEVFIYPSMHSFNAAFIYFTLSEPFGLSEDVLSASLVTYKGLYSATISLIAIQFVYRYWAVFEEAKLRYFQGWYLLFWAFYVLFFGAQWAIGAYYSVKTDDIAADYLRKEMILRYDAKIDNLPSLSMVAFHPETREMRWRNIMTVIQMSIILGIQYGIMISCGWYMYSRMEEKLKMFSVTLRSIHNQLFKTLILQIAAPTIFLLLPLSIAIYIPFLNLELSIPTGVLLAGFSLYPAADSLIVIYVVSEYRQNFKKMLIDCSKRVCVFKANMVNPSEARTTRTL